MDAGRRRGLRYRSMRTSFGSREHWSDVTLDEFEAFLRDYPRPLEARPPLTQRKANYREWVDPTRGRWPDSAVAKSWTRQRCSGWQVRRA